MYQWYPLPEKCPNTELFLVHIFLYLDLIRIRIFQSEYRKIWTRKNSVFGHFSRNAQNTNKIMGTLETTHYKTFT